MCSPVRHVFRTVCCCHGACNAGPAGLSDSIVGLFVRLDVEQHTYTKLIPSREYPVWITCCKYADSALSGVCRPRFGSLARWTLKRP